MLGWRNQDTWYYGVRFAKGCDPTDLWVKYKSSSQLVKAYAQKHGDPDVVRIMRIFSSGEDACNHEKRFIQRWGLVHSNRFLNRAVSNQRGRSPVGMRRNHTPETIEKMRASWAKRRAAGYVRKGRKKTNDERAAIAERQRRRFQNASHRDRQQRIIRIACEAAARANRGRKRPDHVSELFTKRRSQTGTRYPTPRGLLRRQNDLFTEDLITTWCKNPDVVISYHSYVLGVKRNDIEESWIGKTRREVGFSEPITL